MQYTMKCPAPGCTYSATVDAPDDETAVKMLMDKAATEHNPATAHPDTGPMTPEQAEAMVRQNMHKVEAPQPAAPSAPPTPDTQAGTDNKPQDGGQGQSGTMPQ